MKSKPKRTAKYRLAASMMSNKEKSLGFKSPFTSKNWEIHRLSGLKKNMKNKA